MSTPYDDVPYPCNAYAQTHPSHLGAIGRLLGMRPAPTEGCRVLELGCGDGGNLLPLAYALPDCRFLGIDLAETSIQAGQSHAATFGLPNIELKAADLLSLDPASLGPGQWDYIIAHGVFSWVPEVVRLRLLALCRELLAPQGIAFISYNAYPGSHVRNMIREILIYHTELAPDPATKIGQGRALLQFLSQSHGVDDEVGALLRAEAQRVLSHNPNHFYHDDLADLNQPFYLHQFADLAAAHGLQYLGDADYASMHATRYPPEVRQVLEGIGADPIRREQYLDFLKCRRFRQTLLCHAEVELSRQSPANLQFLGSLHLTSSAKPAEADANLTDDRTVAFAGEGNLKLNTSHPAAKTALAALGAAWPASLTAAEIESAVTTATGAAPPPELLSGILLEFLQMGAAEAHTGPAPFTTQIAERPRASAWARYQAAHGPTVTNLRHQTLRIQDDFGRWLLTQLDGSRTQEEIAAGLAATVKPAPGATLDPDKELQEARDLVAQGVSRLADLGLLEFSPLI